VTWETYWLPAMAPGHGLANFGYPHFPGAQCVCFKASVTAVRVVRKAPEADIGIAPES
jgi:hypothetical protein